MSAAFDIVDHSILLSKLKLYGFDAGMVAWISSYLSSSSQCVSIDGTLSKLQPVHHGVPQGSILGPLLYIIFTNEIPEVVHSECDPDRFSDSQDNWPKFNMGCKLCGSIGCYADDTTYTCSGSFAVELSEKLTSKY